MVKVKVKKAWTRTTKKELATYHSPQRLTRHNLLWTEHSKINSQKNRPQCDRKDHKRPSQHPLPCKNNAKLIIKITHTSIAHNFSSNTRLLSIEWYIYRSWWCKNRFTRDRVQSCFDVEQSLSHLQRNFDNSLILKRNHLLAEKSTFFVVSSSNILTLSYRLCSPKT